MSNNKHEWKSGDKCRVWLDGEWMIGTIGRYCPSSKGEWQILGLHNYRPQVITTSGHLDRFTSQLYPLDRDDFPFERDEQNEPIDKLRPGFEWLNDKDILGLTGCAAGMRYYLSEMYTKMWAVRHTNGVIACCTREDFGLPPLETPAEKTARLIREGKAVHIESNEPDSSLAIQQTVTDYRATQRYKSEDVHPDQKQYMPVDRCQLCDEELTHQTLRFSLGKPNLQMLCGVCYHEEIRQRTGPRCTCDDFCNDPCPQHPAVESLSVVEVRESAPFQAVVSCDKWRRWFPLFLSAGIPFSLCWDDDNPIVKDAPPSIGIWILQGHIDKLSDGTFRYAPPMLGQSPWRQPTEGEWKAIKERRNPWL